LLLSELMAGLPCQTNCLVIPCLMQPGQAEGLCARYPYLAFIRAAKGNAASPVRTRENSARSPHVEASEDGFLWLAVEQQQRSGRARLATIPVSTGSRPAITIGISLVSCLVANAVGAKNATMTSTRTRTSSAAFVARSSALHPQPVLGPAVEGITLGARSITA
jgi:hypothetical protein